MIHFTANIEPMGCVRMTQRGKWVKESAQRYLSYKEAIGMIARSKRPLDLLTGPIEIKLIFYYPIPKGWSKKKQEQCDNKELLPIVKPDLDNCVKGIFDALNGVIWKDDNQVVKVESHKWYSYEPRIEVFIQRAGAKEFLFGD